MSLKDDIRFNIFLNKKLVFCTTFSERESFSGQELFRREYENRVIKRKYFVEGTKRATPEMGFYEKQSSNNRNMHHTHKSKIFLAKRNYAMYYFC